MLSATERLSLPPITLEVGGFHGSRVGRSVLGARADAERRTLGDDHGRADRRHRPARPRLHGHAQDAARRRRHVGARRARLGLGRRHDDQRPDAASTSRTTASRTRTPARTRATTRRPALDSIAEVKVQASNFQAEYGRTSGATIVVVTKSGSSKFSGTAAYFKRNEDVQREHAGTAAGAATRADRRPAPCRPTARSRATATTTPPTRLADRC